MHISVSIPLHISVSISLHISVSVSLHISVSISLHISVYLCTLAYLYLYSKVHISVDTKHLAIRSLNCCIYMLVWSNTCYEKDMGVLQTLSVTAKDKF